MCPTSWPETRAREARSAWRSRYGRCGLAVGALALLAAPSASWAQDPVVPPAVRLPPQSPESYLGFRPGDDYEVVDWGQVTGYLADLARKSARVSIDTIGRSTLDRPMVLLTVTDTSNHARLDAILAAQQRMADPRTIAHGDERAELIRSGRAVVLVTAAIHPTEVGASLVPLSLAYRLATTTDAALLRVLRECVVLIVPSVNPDGVDIVADWYRESVGTPWEGRPPPALYHHYTGHDNNRDWYSLTQVETRNVVQRVYNVWHPQVVHDIHQQGMNGSRYFVPPWRDPIEPNVDPLLIAATNALGTAVAWDLVRQGKRGVVVNAHYDAWSPARAYAHYHGAARILSETAGARLATPVRISADQLQTPAGNRTSWNHPAPWTGGEWGLSNILDYMEAGALALLRHVGNTREEWLANFVTVGERAVAGWPSWPRAWVVPAVPGREAGMAELTRILRTGDVEVEVAATRLTSGQTSWPAGSLVVDMRQPYASFAQMLLAPQAYPGGPEFPGGPLRTPYDVTAHNLPLFLGLEATPLSRRPSGELRPIEGTPAAAAGEIEGVSDEPGLLVGLYRSWVPSTDEGWTRWLFDRYEVPYATLHDGTVRQGELERRFTSIVLPSMEPQALMEGWAPGSMPAEYAGGLGSPGVEALRAFVEAGGTLVALGRSSGWIADQLGLPVVDRLRGQSSDVFLAPGAQVALRVDTTTSVGRGMPVTTAAWIEGGSAFDVPSRSPAVPVATYGPRPRVLSGWVHGTNALAGAAAVVEVPLGRGRVVLYGIDPQQRGISMATFPLLFNALRLRN